MDIMMIPKDSKLVCAIRHFKTTEEIIEYCFRDDQFTEPSVVKP